MPPAHGWDSRIQELPATDRDLIELVIPSSVLSCQQASGGASFRAAAVAGYWRSPPEERRSRVHGGIQLIFRWWRDCAPAVLTALPLNVTSLTACFLGAIVYVEEVFEEVFGVLGRDLECRDLKSQ